MIGLFDDLLVVVALASIFIKGFHAVTRPGMLLSFLGAYIKEEGQIRNLKPIHEERLLSVQSDFFEDLDNMTDKEEIVELVSKYEKAVLTCEIIDDYGPLLKEFARKKELLFWRVVCPIAPAWSECETCMGSLWSAVFLALYFSGLLFTTICGVILFPFLVAGVITIINR